MKYENEPYGYNAGSGYWGWVQREARMMWFACERDYLEYIEMEDEYED